MKLTGTKWSQYYPKKLGSFECSPKYVVQNSGSVIGTPAQCTTATPRIRDRRR